MPTSGIAHEHMEMRDPDGRVKEVDGWTGCYTPRELRLLLAAHGLDVDRISSVEPGRYGARPAEHRVTRVPRHCPRSMRPAKALERPPCRTGSSPLNDAVAC